MRLLGLVTAHPILLALTANSACVELTAMIQYWVANNVIAIDLVLEVSILPVMQRQGSVTARLPILGVSAISVQLDIMDTLCARSATVMREEWTRGSAATMDDVFVR